MLIKVQKPPIHFKAYYQDNSLLIQLMIIELSEIRQQMDYFIDWENSDSIIYQEDNLDQLKQRLITLTGEQTHRDCLLTSHWAKSPLTHLKDYCENFFYNADLQCKSHHKLSIHIYQIWLSATNILHLLRSLPASLNLRQKTTIHSQIKRAIQTLTLHLNLSTKQILSVLKIFKDDENVIFFLLRKKDLLAKLYSLDEINKLFKSFAKKHNLIQLLIKRFKSRGFNHLLPAIKQELFLYESYKHFRP